MAIITKTSIKNEEAKNKLKEQKEAEEYKKKIENSFLNKIRDRVIKEIKNFDKRLKIKDDEWPGGIITLNEKFIGCVSYIDCGGKDIIDDGFIVGFSPDNSLEFKVTINKWRVTTFSDRGLNSEKEIEERINKILKNIYDDFLKNEES